MNTSKNFLILLSFFHGSIFAQQMSSCTNADFELHNFSNWIAETGYCFPVTMTATGVAGGRHTLISSGGTDPYSLGRVPLVPAGAGTTVVRLGNDNVGSQAERLSNPFTVTAANALFIYRYAVVLEDPGHPPIDQPRFTISVYDQSGNAIPCGTYDVSASANIPGFFNNMDYRIKPWATVGIDLSSYIGQTVTIEFTTADCGWGGHFGYAYLECYCSPFQITSDFCPGIASTTLSAPIGFASYLWSTGDTTVSITISNPVNGATYFCTMTSVTGCQVTLTTTLVPTVLFADFYATSLCANHVTFIDSSYILTGTPIIQWSWDFGDGNTSSQQYPAHTYDTAGTYYVHLTATNAGGCYDSITIPVQTIPFPNSNFSTSPVCYGLPISFTDMSSIPSGTITEWIWNFHDGTPNDSIQNPVHLYNSGLSHNITLIVTASNGCMDTTTALVFVEPLPVVTFSCQPVCYGNDMYFTDGSSLANGSVTGWSWNFGDGSPVVSQQNPVHRYNAPGFFPVVLTVTGSNGCTADSSIPAQVYPLPSPSFNYLTACVNTPMQFSDHSIAGAGSVVAWSWNFHDSAVSNMQHPAHVFNEPLFHQVSVITTTSLGCIDSVTQSVYVSPLPEPDFKSPQACYPGGNLFTDASTVFGGTITSWHWEFGDGTFQSYTPLPTHYYPAAGQYTVKLTVQSNHGCVDSVAHSLEVWNKPVAGFLPAVIEGCEPLQLLFMNVSASQDGQIEQWHWDFGNGEEDTVPRGQVIYSSGGTYTVSLIVTTSHGCRDTASYPNLVTVYPKPEAGFTFSPAHTNIYNPFISFQDASGAAQSWYWNFGDGSESEEMNPVHTYLEAGWYEVMQLVTSVHGCLDTLVQKLRIEPEYFYHVPNSFTPNGDGKNETFIGKGIGVNDFLMSVLDRWGKVIYETRDKTAAWDGTHKNDPVQEGVYVYKIQLTDDFHDDHELIGHVSLIR